MQTLEHGNQETHKPVKQMGSGSPLCQNDPQHDKKTTCEKVHKEYVK